MSSRSDYIRTETLISMAINTVLSIGFVLLVFHGHVRVPVLGSHGIVVDMAPQTFMVTLMGCLVPGLLTRSRMQGGARTWHLGSTNKALGHVIVAAVLAAFGLTVVVVLLCWAVLPHLLADGAGFRSLLVVKAIYGAALAALVTPWAIRRVIGAPATD